MWSFPWDPRPNANSTDVRALRQLKGAGDRKEASLTSADRSVFLKHRGADTVGRGTWGSYRFGEYNDWSYMQVCNFSLLGLFVQTRLLYLWKLPCPGYQVACRSGQLSLATTVRGKELEFQHRVFLGHRLASLFKVYSDIFQLLRSKEWAGEERGSRNRAGVLGTV